MANMKIIAIETSTEACSAALYLDGKVHERHRLAPREHTELILPMIDSLLAEADIAQVQLDAVAFGRGPGAFTGVRIGTSVAQGIAFALDIPAIPVSTLAAMAHGAWREFGNERVISTIDARMGEIYCGSYIVSANGVVLTVAEEQVVAPEKAIIPEGGEWLGVGSGWQTYGEVLHGYFGNVVTRSIADRYPHAHDVVLIGAEMIKNGVSVKADEALPLYLRDQVVQRTGKK